MIRSGLLALSRSPRARRTLPRLPFVRRAVRRFMPGESVAEALAAVDRLAGHGFGTVLTLLGEDVTSREEAWAVVDAYGELLTAAGGRDLHLSVKPTQLGLAVGEAAAAEGLQGVSRLCLEAGVPLWVDMEGSETVDATLRLYRRLKEENPSAGLCLQAYLHRTPADLESLLPLEPRIRLVKGAYAEPPRVALARKAEVDQAFARLTSQLLARAAEGGAVAVLGTHDLRLIRRAQEEAGVLGLGEDRWAVHMLYGIREAEQRTLRGEGVPLRVLISYGSAWFPWYVRRLAERPANLWFVARSLVG